MAELVEKLAEILMENFNAKEAADFNSKKQITELFLNRETKKETKQQATWNPEKIHWTERNGTNGTYYISEDHGNPDFQAMFTDLYAHNGFLNREDFSYWIMNDKNTAGRKRRR